MDFAHSAKGIVRRNSRTVANGFEIDHTNRGVHTTITDNFTHRRELAYRHRQIAINNR